MNFWSRLERLLEKPDDPLPEKADVVIGAGIDISKDGMEASPYSAAVAWRALEMFQQARARNILLSGGYSAGGPTEAEVMANIIADKVPPMQLSLDIKSYRTYQNADVCRWILQKHGWKSAIVVAQQWHARRVKATFGRRWHGSGIEFAVIKARSRYGGGSLRRLDYFWSFLIWDILAFIISKIKGYC